MILLWLLGLPRKCLTAMYNITIKRTTCFLKYGNLTRMFPTKNTSVLIIVCDLITLCLLLDVFCCFRALRILKFELQFVIWLLLLTFGCLPLLQGTLMAIRDWFRDYKIPDGKPANKFGLGNKAANKVNLASFSWRLCIPSNPLSSMKHLTWIHGIISSSCLTNQSTL